MAARVATVIVAYHSEDHLPACVAAAPPPVWVVDNSAAGQPNLGFAGGVNRGFVLSKEPFVLVLNPDCVVVNAAAAVEAMLAEFDRDAQVGAVGGLLLDAETGHPQTGFTVRRFPTSVSLACEVLGLNWLWPGNPVNRKYRCLDLNLSAPQDVDQPAGAFLMIRRAAFDAIGGFDTRFHPVWFEDVDFCKRLKTAGWAVRYTPEAIARHAGGHAVHRMPAASKTLAWYGSLQWYAAKHFARPGRWLVALSLLGSALPRGVAGMLRQSNPSLLGVQLRVAAFAVKRLIFEDLKS